jgi:hypothetical protein
MAAMALPVVCNGSPSHLHSWSKAATVAMATPVVCGDGRWLQRFPQSSAAASPVVGRVGIKRQR